MPPSPSKSSDKSDSSPARTRPSWLRWLVRIALWITGLAAAAAVGLALTIAVALSVAYPNLPDISDLADYRPKLPLRVYSAEGALLGEFGEERRNLTPIDEIPQVMKTQCWRSKTLASSSTVVWTTKACCVRASPIWAV